MPMKSADEIKKGLVETIEECAWVVEGGDAHDLQDACDKAHASMADALALIQQLEAEISDAKNNHQHTIDIAERQKGQIDRLKKVVVRLNAERAAAVAELKMIGECRYCKHDTLCTVRFPNCVECQRTDCPCHTCKYRDNWEWRGVQKEGADEQ